MPIDEQNALRHEGDDQVQQSGDCVMTKATAPIDLLRELRTGFEAEAKHFRGLEQTRMAGGGRRAAGVKAFAAEQAVKKIDATLRDWA